MGSSQVSLGVRTKHFWSPKHFVSVLCFESLTKAVLTSFSNVLRPLRYATVYVMFTTEIYFNTTKSYVWKWCMGFEQGWVVDKVFLNFARCTLNVKATTCNAVVYGECGRYPLSVFCHINVLCWPCREKVFHTLDTLRGHGFATWVTKAYELAQICDIDMNSCAALTAKQFKSLCTERMKSVFVEHWHTELCDKPLLRSYRLYKNEFNTECYLDYINVRA